MKREAKRIDLIFFSSDTGLAGAFNSNLLKAAQKFHEEHAGAAITLTLVGRKGRDFYRKRHAFVLSEHINVLNKPGYQDAASIAQEVIRRYKEGETDAVFVINNDFKSVMAANLSVAQLLPLELPKQDAGKTQTDYIYEQSPLEMLES